MRADVKAELQMLRELVWFLVGVPHPLNGKTVCYFCHKPLLDLPSDVTFGHRRHNKIDVKITLHHEDLNRENNSWSNLYLCHDSCHRSYHNKLRAAVRQEVLKQTEVQSG